MESAVCESRNLNSFYSYTNKKIKNQAFIPPLKSTSGSTAVIDVAKAEELNAAFQNVFTTDNGVDVRLDPLPVPCLNDFVITAEDIYAAVSKISKTISSTPDCIPAHFLRRIAPFTVEVL